MKQQKIETSGLEMMSALLIYALLVKQLGVQSEKVARDKFSHSEKKNWAAQVSVAMVAKPFYVQMANELKQVEQLQTGFEQEWELIETMFRVMDKWESEWGHLFKHTDDKAVH